MLWPGLGFTGLYFQDLAARLPHAVAVDPPGHGGTPELRWEEYSLPNLADLACDVIDATGAENFVGHSWGGTVGAVIAANAPRRLRALVLVDGGFVPGAATLLERPQPTDRDSLIAFAREAGSQHDSWDAAFAELRGELGGTWTARAEAVAREVFVEDDGRVCERLSAHAAAAVLDGLAGHDPLGCAARIREAGLPTLLLVGARTPALEKKRAAWESFTAAAGPTLELRIDDAVGHHLLLEAPERYVPLVAEWLEHIRD